MVSMTARQRFKVDDEDAKLVYRFLDGDDSAFAEIVLRYQERLYTVAFSFTQDRSDAQEVVQDTFIRAHRSLPKFRGDASLSTWLHRIAANQARNRFWYNRRRMSHRSVSIDAPVLTEGDLNLGDMIPAKNREASQEMELGEFEKIARICMEKLHADHREIIMMRNILNRSYDDIAEDLGVQVGTVKSRLARARENLHEIIKSRYGECAGCGSDWFIPRRRAERIDR